MFIKDFSSVISVVNISSRLKSAIICMYHACHSANWDIFSLMCGADKVWITKLVLNYKILGQIVTRMRQFIGQSDVKHIITSLITTITSVLKALTDIITNIPAHSSRVTEILAIMSVSTFKIDIILYLLCVEIKEKIYKSLIKLYFRSNKTKKYSYKDQNSVCSCFLDFLFL